MLIVDKIIEHRINILVLENNTDTSLKEVLEERLRFKNYLHCTIIEKYSTQNKEQRMTMIDLMLEIISFSHVKECSL